MPRYPHIPSPPPKLDITAPISREPILTPYEGAILNEVPTSDDPKDFSFAGSTLVVQATSREEIKEILRKDIYAQAGVWDVENVSYMTLFTSSK